MKSMNPDKIYSFKSPRIQYFSIPSNIIYYINHNLISPKGLEKLQQTCKWFFAKNRVIIVADGYFTYKEWPLFKTGRVYHAIHKFNSKFWFTKKLKFETLQSSFRHAAVTVCSKLYRCNITSLYIDFIDLNIREFKKLTSSNNLQTVYIINSVIYDDTKTDILLDDLLKEIPSATKFKSIKSNINKQKRTITNDTFKNMIQIKNDNSIKNFAISGYTLSPTLDLQLFCSLIKKAAAPKSSFRFYLDYSFPEQKAQIETAVTEMLSQWNDPQQKPFIHMRYSI